VNFSSYETISKIDYFDPFRRLIIERQHGSCALRLRGRVGIHRSISIPRRCFLIKFRWNEIQRAACSFLLSKGRIINEEEREREKERREGAD